eukprot:gene386-453_t
MFEPSSFMFTLVNPHNIPPTKYLYEGQHLTPIYPKPGYSSLFGSCTGQLEPYIRIGGKYGHSYASLPTPATSTPYSSPSGPTPTPVSVFTGDKKFRIDDVEVFVL